MKNRTRLTVLLAATALAFSGCGDDTTPTAADPTPTTLVVAIR